MLLFTLLVLVQNSILYQQTDLGCLTKINGICTQLCPLGQQECSGTSPKCEYGYFQYKNTCTQCPYQTVNDILKLYCMDCVEHPYSWKNDRKCSYEYSIESGMVGTGTIVQMTKTYTELFFIGEAVVPGISTDVLPRDVNFEYAVYSCSGCKDFCTPTSLNDCSAFTSPYSEDSDKLGISCLEGYYFSQNLCNSCPNNCLSCISSTYCLTCESGYSVSIINQGCMACPNNCLSCAFKNGQQICFSCQSPQISSLSQDKCESCGSSCDRCEYTTYEDKMKYDYPTRVNALVLWNQQKYIKRCRQCSGTMTIHYNGIDCVECQIRYCQKCYYNIRGIESNYESTMDVDFKPSGFGDTPSEQLCFACDSLYYLDQDKKSCVPYSITSITNCDKYKKVDNQIKCQLCLNNIILDQFVGGCFGLCTEYISSCQRCYSYQAKDQTDYVASDGSIKTKPAQTLFQCVKCDNGYYPDFFTGLCLSCPNQCQNCWQYTPTYNLTDYLNKFEQVNNEKKETFLNDYPILIKCSQCKSGFNLYDGVCLGCTSNCQIANPNNDPNVMDDDLISSCTYKSNFAFCSECYDNFHDRSLTADKTECHKCPHFCQACRDRTISEIVNRYFNPANSNLLQYGRLCYQRQKLTGDTNTVVSFNTYLGLPIICLNSETQSCKHSAEITVVVYCNSTDYDNAYTTATEEDQKYIYDLSSYYEQDSESVAQIDFGSLETFALYSALNQLPVEQMQLNIKFKGESDGTCTFSKDTFIMTSFQKNVFALIDFKVVISSYDGNSVDFNLEGNLYLQDYSELQLDHLNIYSSSNTNFGLVVNGTQPTKVTLSNMNFGFKVNSTTNPVFSFLLSSISVLNIDSVTFQYLKFSDIFQIYQKSMSSQIFTINSLTLIYCNFKSTQLFPLIQNSIMKITGMVINQCLFIETYLFQDENIQYDLTSTLQMTQMVVKFSIFQNSIIIFTQYLNKLTMDQIDLVENRLSATSLIVANQYTLSNMLITNNQINDQSIIIDSIDKIQDFAVTSIQLQSINSIKFVNNICGDINCFLRFSTPFNLQNVISDLELSNIYINQNTINFGDSKIKSITSALIRIYTIGHLTMTNIHIDNTQKVTAIYIQGILSLSVDGFLCDWSNPSVGTYYYNPTISIQNNSQILYATNNKLPPSSDCLERSKVLDYNQYCLYIKDFEYGVSIKNAGLKRLLTIDTSFIYIQSYSSMEKQTSGIERPISLIGQFYYSKMNEIIILENVRVYNTTIGIDNPSASLSAITIESDQLQSIQITNFKAIDNHLHQLADAIGYQSGTVLLIQSPQSNITIDSSTFQRNRATQSYYGIIFLKGATIIILNTLFQDTNIITSNWIDRLEENQFTSQEEMADYFTIESMGSNLFIQSQTLIVDGCQFNNAYSQGGAAIYFIGSNMATINITNTKFTDMIASLQPTDQSSGGCLFINSLYSSLDMFMTNVTMINGLARNKGGCIYIDPSLYSQYVEIIDSIFIGCQSLQGQILSAEFSISSKTAPNVMFEQCQFMNNRFLNFLSNLPTIGESDKQKILISSGAIEQNYGYLTIQNCQFQNITHVSLLKLENIINLIVLSTQIENCTIYVSPMIKCSMNSDVGQIKFSDVSITSTNQQSLSTKSQMLNQFNDSNCELNTAISIIPITQVCPEIQLIRQVSLLIINYYLASYTLYNSTIESIYNNLVDKYVQPTIDIDSYSPLDQYTTSTYTFTNYIYYSSFTQIENCFLTDIYDSYNDTLASSMNLTSILYVPQLISANTINLTSLTIQNTNCLRCLGGLVQINQIDSNSMDSIIVQDMLCYQNIIGFYGCLMFTTASEYKTNSLTRLLVSTRNIQILQSFFIENQASIGTAVSLFGLTAIIEGSQFLDNTASLIGGAIVMQPDSTTMTEPLLLTNSNFYGNKAQIAGAILLSGASLPNSTINSNQFKGNKATLFGDDSETYPQKLTIQMKVGTNLPTQTYLNYTGDSDLDGFIDDTSTEIIDIISLQSYTIFSQNATTFLMLPSGQAISSYSYYYSYTEEQVPYDWVFRIIHLDQNKATIQSAVNSDSCSITGRLMDKDNYDNNKTFLTNFTSINTINFDTKIGAYDLGQLQVYFDPSFESNLFLQLRFECTSVKIPVYQSTSPYSIQGHNSEYSLLVNIRTFPCQLGEAKNGQKCIACTEGTETYSVKENSLQCTGIDTSKMIDVTPIKINLRGGYWRAQANNDIVESCINLVENCNGGWIPGYSSCYSGHVGALCETCDINSIRGESYSISKKYTCGACSQTIQTNTLTIIAISAFTLISMVFSVKGNYQMIETFIHEQVLISIGVRIAQTSNNLSILIKLLTNYLQIITALTTFRISIPTSFVSSMEVLGNPTQSMSYSLDCFLILMTPVDIIYFRMIWALMMPIIYLIIFFFGYSLAILAGKAPLKKGIIYTTFIYMFIYLQPTLVGGFISLLSSRTIGGIEWVQSDVSYRYNTDTHFFWLLIFIGPNLLLWAIIFPCIFMYLVRQIRDKLTEIESRKKWGYFYNEYTQGAYLWEFVKIFEKELVIIGLTYYEDKIVIKGLIVFLIVFFYGAFSFEFTPYKMKTLNKIDQLSTAVCAVSLCLGVLIYASQSENMDYLQYIMFCIIGFINGLFILYLVYNLFEGYLEKFQDIVDKLRDAIKKKYPQIEFQHPFLRKWLINRKQMKERVKQLWSFLRYETKKGIDRKRHNSALPLFDIHPIILVHELSQEKELNIPKQDLKPISRSGIHENNEESNQLNPDTPGKMFQNPRSSNSLQVLLQSGQSSKSPEPQKIYPILESSPVEPQEKTALKKVRY